MKSLSTIITAVLLFCLFSQAAFTQEKVKTDTHTWYYFTKDGLIETSKPQDAPLSLFKPWTEAVRVSSASITQKNGYLLVNRLGLLSCKPTSKNSATKSSESSKPVLSPDVQIFTNTTVDSLLTNNGYPVFHVYRNTLFNEELNLERINKIEDEIPMLVQFQSESGIFYPILFTSDLFDADKESQLTASKASETSEVYFDGDKWNCVVKALSDDRVLQQYVSFSTITPLSVASQTQHKNTIQVQSLTADTYRAITTPSDYSIAPKRLTTLLASIPESFPFYITCMTPDCPTPLKYIRQNDTGEPISAHALLGDIFSIAVFSDGTTYFSGSLPNRYVLNGGELIAFRLPKLPVGFTYGTFTVAGSTLYISWEESDFYKTGRSGILTVNLDKVLY